MDSTGKQVVNEVIKRGDEEKEENEASKAPDTISTSSGISEDVISSRADSTEAVGGNCVIQDKKTSDVQNPPEGNPTQTVNQPVIEENREVLKIDDEAIKPVKELATLELSTPDMTAPEAKNSPKGHDSSSPILENSKEEPKNEVIQAREDDSQQPSEENAKLIQEEPKTEVIQAEEIREGADLQQENAIATHEASKSEITHAGNEIQQLSEEENPSIDGEIQAEKIHREETTFEILKEEVLPITLADVDEEKNEVNEEPEPKKLKTMTPPPSPKVLESLSQVEITITPPPETPEDSKTSPQESTPEAEPIVNSPSVLEESINPSIDQNEDGKEAICQRNDKTIVVSSKTIEMSNTISPKSSPSDSVSAPAIMESSLSDKSLTIMRATAPDSTTPIPPPRRLSQAIFFNEKMPSKSSTLSSKKSTLSIGKLSLSSSRYSTLSSVREEVTSKKKKGMFSWLGGDSSKKKNKEVLESVSDGLRKIYKQKLYPLEEHYKFHDFHSPALDDPDFDAKPMILLVGQYSTGKTTFIRYLLEQDFPGIRIGPEPTTDRFIAVMHGDEEGVIPGNALVVDAKKQFRALSGFGNAFLNRFQCSTLKNQVLESITIVDTPGILSGEKQRIDRGYDFTGVLEWFAERVDRIILLFDAHKLDISDEFKRCIEALGGNEDKIRIVLNKSDMVDHQQLMRVYGALMWSLGKVFRTPEVSRVYLGSFWDKPLTYDINRRLFVDEQHDLFQDLQALPRNAALRKLNDLIKRARLAKVHAYIISELRKQMPSMIGKDKKKKELIQNLDKIFEQIQREHNISPGDFPDIQKMREKLQNQDFTKFNPLKPKLLEVVDGMLASDIARLMAQIPKEEQQAENASSEQPTVRGGAFAQASEAETPFGFGRYSTIWGEGFDKGADEQGWVVSRERTVADSTFESLAPVNGFISGRAAKEHMVKSKLPNAVLGKIWKLADVDQDGQLDADEFALANYLINLKLEGHELPAELPTHLIPPSKREKEAVYPNLDEE